MKLRKDFLLAIFILFVIPILGYLVLVRAEDDRMKVSDLLVEMPYVLKVISIDNTILEREQLEHMLYIINNRSDLAFMNYENPLEHTAKTRIMGFNYVNDTDDLSSFGDVLLVDVYNRILQVYDRSDSELYKKLLEDISYAFPMIDFQIEKNAKDDQSE